MRTAQSFTTTDMKAARIKDLEAACIQAIKILRRYVSEYDSPTIIMLKKAVGHQQTGGAKMSGNQLEELLQNWSMPLSSSCVTASHMTMLSHTRICCRQSGGRFATSTHHE
jgi:sulfur relay (sulfurtransferase) DsrC/TusE family protein